MGLEKEPRPQSKRRDHTTHKLRREASAAALKSSSPEDQKIILDLQDRALRELQMTDPAGRVGTTVAEDFIQALAHQLAK